MAKSQRGDSVERGNCTGGRTTRTRGERGDSYLGLKELRCKWRKLIFNLLDFEEAFASKRGKKENKRRGGVKETVPDKF